MKLLIYVPQLSPRIKYIFSFIFNDILKAEIDFTVNADEFNKSTLPKLSYAERPIGQELFFRRTNLLFEYKIKPRQIKKTNFGEMKVPFPVLDSALPFDIFAASFYFLSRYEEYIHSETKKTEPYTFKNSLQYRTNLLKTPVIDNWALILKNMLLNHFPDLTFGSKRFTFQQVYIYPSKKLNRYGLFSNSVTRIRSFIDKITTTKSAKLEAIEQVISDQKDYGFVGEPISVTPGHHIDHRYIAELHIPKSYVKLTKHNTKNDYSMYYPGYAGFRAGTCTPFYWYDLQMEKKTSLLLHPAGLSDINLLKNKTTEGLLLQMNDLISSVKLVNGEFYFLTLCNDIRPQ